MLSCIQTLRTLSNIRKRPKKKHENAARNSTFWPDCIFLEVITLTPPTDIIKPLNGIKWLFVAFHEQLFIIQVGGESCAQNKQLRLRSVVG